MTDAGMPTSAPDEAWFSERGFVRTRDSENGSWEKAWSHRSGYDFTSLVFDPWRTGRYPTRWEAIIRHHASGLGPNMSIGACDTLAEMQTIYEAIRAINGYPSTEQP